MDAQIQAANAIEIDKTMLKTLLGLSVEQEFAVSETLNQSLPMVPVEFDVLLSQTRSQHPELKAAEKHTAIAEQQLKLHLPRADAYVSYGSGSKDLAFSSKRGNVSAGVMVEVDIFSGFGIQEKIKKAGHELAAAREAARQMHLRVESQVKTARLRLEEVLNRERVISVAVEAAKEALRLVNEQRQAGVVMVTRYIEAEVVRDKAKTRDVSARHDALRAEAD